jgi:hypothetical protein
MADIFLERTNTSPEVDFSFSSHKLSMTGEAYPEDAHEFFNPILKELESYLNTAEGLDIEFNFHLTYFNSAATKMLYSMFELLNDAAFAGNHVKLNWFHDEEDDTSLEFGEGVQQDYTSLDFEAIVTA